MQPHNELCAQRPIVLLGNQAHPPKGLPAKHLQSFAFCAPSVTSLQQRLAHIALAESCTAHVASGPHCSAERMQGDLR